ncbi:hypothetical protein A2696_02640 [Candidatus Curtissbacteria bacterium RIFCSPHIGHO2_01_FULL_41_13]|uniref:Glycoside hydrolase family 5 domain-containing protein n=2 Tax=Microgenomates group TaxID=1794810 RepID=A0A1F5G2K7_9BACT|nr:MAG: hypothetical protein A2696_02640 [Candidatus Curtissbacteria bacterium RIFCSPHIGHO2_01_FULL_41_13]OGK41566.1 MAG: hypothetical protein A3A74_08085 [Candidatus Roizmanbacteria bacterium RIFCSPLOWO2_01_FULL_35_13]
MLGRIFFILFLVLAVYIFNAFLNPIPRRNMVEGFRPLYGVSYSFEQAGWYGLDPKKSYVDLLDNLKVDWVRLPFFWDQMTLPLRQSADSEGQAEWTFNKNFEDLKWAVSEADRRNIKVIIALGAKTPYFPEYHWPKEIASKVRFGEQITSSHPVASDILEIDKKVVGELSSYDNIIYWQVENEPLIGNVNKWKIDSSLIAKEVEIVKQADFKKRPVILNHAAVGFYDKSWQKLLPILQPNDVFAVNTFFKTKGTDLVTAKIFGREIHILWPNHLVWPVHSWFFLSPNYQAIKQKVEDMGLKFWVLEMQSEPYIKKLDEANDPILTFSPQDIELGDKFLRSYKIESIGLWGASFWQYRQKNGDSSWTEAVQSLINH